MTSFLVLGMVYKWLYHAQALLLLLSSQALFFLLLSLSYHSYYLLFNNGFPVLLWPHWPCRTVDIRFSHRPAPGSPMSAGVGKPRSRARCDGEWFVTSTNGGWMEPNMSVSRQSTFQAISSGVIWCYLMLIDVNWNNSFSSNTGSQSPLVGGLTLIGDMLQFKLLLFCRSWVRVKEGEAQFGIQKTISARTCTNAGKKLSCSCQLPSRDRTLMWSWPRSLCLHDEINDLGHLGKIPRIEFLMPSFQRRRNADQIYTDEMQWSAKVALPIHETYEPREKRVYDGRWV